jgi:hypothetical protein
MHPQQFSLAIIGQAHHGRFMTWENTSEWRLVSRVIALNPEDPAHLFHGDDVAEIIAHVGAWSDGSTGFSHC